MKKTLALLLSLLLIMIAFVSCNLDGTSGILWSVASSSEPLSIRYKQLLGADAYPLNTATKLYFRTASGIQQVTKPKSKETIVANKFENIILSAAYKPAPVNKLFYTTNNINERAANTINAIDPIAKTKTPGTAISTIISAANLNINDLFANSMIIVEEKNGNGKLFELLKYNGTLDFDTSVASFDFTASTTKHGIHKVIQQTGKEQNDTVPMIVSFVKDTDKYIHYLIDTSSLPATPIHITKFDNIKIANFYHDVKAGSDKIYILTTDGILYYAGTLSTPTSKETMIDSNKNFEANAFAYVVDDSTSYHLIAKPSLKNSSLQVYSFPFNTVDNTSVTLKEVKSGYAEELALATIMSSQVKSSTPSVSTDLLVATDVNGMFNITINHDKAYLDNATNGTTSSPEGYTF